MASKGIKFAKQMGHLQGVFVENLLLIWPQSDPATVFVGDNLPRKVPAPSPAVAQAPAPLPVVEASPEAPWWSWCGRCFFPLKNPWDPRNFSGRCSPWSEQTMEFPEKTGWFFKCFLTFAGSMLKTLGVYPWNIPLWPPNQQFKKMKELQPHFGVQGDHGSMLQRYVGLVKKIWAIVGALYKVFHQLLKMRNQKVQFFQKNSQGFLHVSPFGKLT